MTDPFEAFESSLSTGGGGVGLETNPSTATLGGFDDPAAEFLAREQAEMAKIEGGDDLGLNSNSNSNNNGLISADDGFGDFGDIPSSKPSLKQEPTVSSGFESSNDLFGAATTNGDHQNGHTFTNGSSSHQDFDQFGQNETESKDSYSAIHSMDKLSIEPEKIKKWREEQKIRLETKDAEEELKKKEWKESAKKELDDWYRNRQEQLQKTHENNKSAEAELVESRDSSNANAWDKVTRLCEFNPKANKNVRDVSRMRSILLQLKQQPLVR